MHTCRVLEHNKTENLFISLNKHECLQNYMNTGYCLRTYLHFKNVKSLK